MTILIITVILIILAYIISVNNDTKVYNNTLKEELELTERQLDRKDRLQSVFVCQHKRN